MELRKCLRAEEEQGQRGRKRVDDEKKRMPSHPTFRESTASFVRKLYVCNKLVVAAVVSLLLCCSPTELRGAVIDSRKAAKATTKTARLPRSRTTTIATALLLPLRNGSLPRWELNEWMGLYRGEVMTPPTPADLCLASEQPQESFPKVAYLPQSLGAAGPGAIGL